jgi:hypothetical protein
VTIQELGSIGELVVSPAIRNALLEYLPAHPDHPTLLDLMPVMTRHE